jgi:hypothetical protein
MLKAIAGVACVLGCASALAQGAVVYAAPDPDLHQRFNSAREYLSAYVSGLHLVDNPKRSAMMGLGSGPDLKGCGQAAFLVALHNDALYMPPPYGWANLPADKHEETFNVRSSSNKCVIHVKLTVEKLP